MSMEQRGKVLSAALCYAFGFEMPKLDGAETSVVRFICGQFDRAEANRKKNAKNGASGGRPPNTETQLNPTITQTNPTITEQEPNHNLPRTLSPVPRSSSLDPCALSPDGGTHAPTARTRTPAPGFTPPTVEEVATYCQERRNQGKPNSIDPEYFLDYYTTRGWILSNGKPMKDWRGSVRTWEHHDKQRQHEQSSGAGRPAPSSGSPTYVAGQDFLSGLEVPQDGT